MKNPTLNCVLCAVLIFLSVACRPVSSSPGSDSPLHYPVQPPAATVAPTAEAVQTETVIQLPLSDAGIQSRSAATGNGIRCDVNNDGTCNAADSELVTLDRIATAVAKVVVPTQRPTVTPRGTATPQPLPSPTITLVPSATPMEHGGTGKCGQPLDRWHPPIYNGCATGYELGDAPPLWVSQSPKPPLFDGNHSTSAAENTTKHVFMKGYSFKDRFSPCIEIYVIQHGGSMGMERIARFHSTQFWIKDCYGGISYGSTWTDFGVPKLYPEGDRVPTVNFDAVHAERANQGIIRIDRGPGPTCEQWYGAVYGNRPDVSLLICGSVESYTDAEQTNPAGEYDPANWQLTGGLGLYRQYDFVWPLGRIDPGVYDTDQFGRRVANCVTGSGSVTYDGTSYGLQCQRWVIQPSLVQSVADKQPEFGFKRIFAIYNNPDIDGRGVVAPN